MTTLNATRRDDVLLRRLTQNLKEQNWTAITIEFFLLVVGVFLGIQVANWNEDRQQAARQAQYLERLQVDFIGIRDRIQEHFVIYAETVEGTAYVLSLVRVDEASLQRTKVDEERIARGFNGMTQTRIPPPLPATYVEMRSEGQLSYIENTELRDRLAEYDRLLGVLQEVARTTSENMIQQLPAVQRHFTSNTVSDDDLLSGIRQEILAYDLAGMRNDPEFEVAVTLLRSFALNSMQLRQRQLELVESIVQLIDREQSP